MSDSRIGPTAAERAVIAEQVSALVLETPGVLRLEPTVRSAIIGLRAAAADHWRALPGAVKRAADGVIVTSTAGELEVAIDLATRTDHRAVDVAIAVRDRVSEALAEKDVAVARIDVSILTISDE